MLLRTIFLLALLGALAEAILHAASALATATLHQRELDATRDAMIAAVAAAQATLAATIRAGNDPRVAPLPSPLATCFYADGKGCRIVARATFFTPSPAPAATPTACPATDCAIYLQGNSAVAESRVSYDVTASVEAANGDVLVSRRASIAFRTFAVSPYASLVGSLDATVPGLASNGAGDDGGNASQDAATLVGVRYQKSGAGAPLSVSGNVWRAQQEHPATASSSWDR